MVFRTYRGDLGPDEAGAHDQHAPRPRFEPGTEVARIVKRPESHDAIEGRLGRIWPLARACARGNEQSIKIHLLTTGQLDPLIVQVQPGGSNAKTPICINLAQLRKEGVVSPQPSGQHALRQGRSIVWRITLITDHDKLSRKAFIA
jgi:hypothetical protein